MSGYQNTDVVANTNAQHICPAWHLPFDDASVDELRAHDVIEHFFPKDWPPALSEFTRVLKHGGRIVLSFPDFGDLAVGYVEGRYNIDTIRSTVTATVPPFNSCDYDVPESYHRTIHSKQSVINDLTSKGFGQFKSWFETYTWNLFVEAYKP
jgi:ubiquinone/menaquinone biosynthesis C-methylase UbiE